jgi:glycosyltransferase involved in cell wall biosynthesis
MPEPTADGLTLVLPVHNQAAALEPALAAWAAVLDETRRPYEILLVDDGSTDDTAALLTEWTGTPEKLARWPQLRTLRHDQHRGFGASLRTALPEARHPLFFYTGLDYPYSPADFPALLARLEEPIEEPDPNGPQQVDLVSGFRAASRPPAVVRVLGATWRVLARLLIGLPGERPHGWLGRKAFRYRLWLRALFGVRLGDVDSKFKLFRRGVFERFTIQSDGEFVHAEIVAKVNFLGCMMDELPVAREPGPFKPLPYGPDPDPTRWRELRAVFRNPVFHRLVAKDETPPSAPADTPTAPREPLPEYPA